jgi:hypothetical protein
MLWEIIMQPHHPVHIQALSLSSVDSVIPGVSGFSPLRPVIGKCLNCFYFKIWPECRSHVISYIFFVCNITAENIVEKLLQQTFLQFFTVLPSSHNISGSGELVLSFSHCSVLDPSPSHICYGQGHAASLIWTCRWYEITVITWVFIICTIARQITCLNSFHIFPFHNL